MNKILILGCGGTGKSTLARELGGLLDTEVIHLDTHFWLPGWVEPDKEVWHAKVQKLMQKKSWIMDGNYGSTMEIRAAEADTVIFLDFGRLFCIYRVVKRFLMYAGKTRPDVAKGCNEKIDWEFIKWIWSYPRHTRPMVLKLLKADKNKRIYHITRRSEIKNLLNEVKSRLR